MKDEFCDRSCPFDPFWLNDIKVRSQVEKFWEVAGTPWNYSRCTQAGPDTGVIKRRVGKSLAALKPFLLLYEIS